MIQHLIGQTLRELSNDKLTTIAIVGDVGAGDANAFLSLALNAQTALVVLTSDGGDAAEGLLLAKTIHRLGYGTAVIGDFRCMSACALIWISGKTRYLSDAAIVGFHAVYNSSGISSDGNAIYGAFYGQLGLSDRAIRYLTSSPPDGFNPVTLLLASELDIEVLRWSFNDDNTPQETTVGKRFETSDFSTEHGVAISGFDIQGMITKNSSAASCLEICANMPLCKSFTYDTKDETCYPKNGGRVLFANKNAFSGSRQGLNQRLVRSSIQLLRQIDIPGNDLNSLVSDHIEGCIFECESNSDCKAFTYHKKKRMCWLKSAARPRIEAPGFFSGVK